MSGIYNGSLLVLYGSNRMAEEAQHGTLKTVDRTYLENHLWLAGCQGGRGTPEGQGVARQRSQQSTHSMHVTIQLPLVPFPLLPKLCHAYPLLRTLVDLLVDIYVHVVHLYAPWTIQSLVRTARLHPTTAIQIQQ